MKKICFMLLVAGALASCSHDDTQPTGQAKFTVTNPEGKVLEGGYMNLHNDSTGGVAYLWNFGDGQTSTEKNPQPYKYLTCGQYVVTLSITDGNGKTETASLQQTVQCTKPGHHVKS